MWREKVDQHNTGNPIFERIERVIVERAPQSVPNGHDDGGRRSGKSHFFGELMVEKCLVNPGMLAVCIREVQKSLLQSSKRFSEPRRRRSLPGATRDAGGWADHLPRHAGLHSGVDQVARRFRRRVGGGSSDAERSQSVIVAPYYPKGRIGIVGELEPTAEEGRH